MSFFSVPLGSRRRFGPAPADDAPPPQLAQPSPSVYPRSHNHDNESPGKRGREESPAGDPKGKQKDYSYNPMTAVFFCALSRVFIAANWSTFSMLQALAHIRDTPDDS
jgi:hypothetical protein